MKLNVGCGNDIKKGYINIDKFNLDKVDLVMNLEKDSFPMEDNSIEKILAFHVLEHINNLTRVMHEFYRISKKGSNIIIKVPFYTSWGQFNDPTHVRFFTPFTFNYFKKGGFSHEVECFKDMFEVEKVEIRFAIGRLKFMNKILNPIINLNHGIYCRFFAYILPSSEIYYKLKVIK